MTVTGWIQILLYCLIIVALTPLLGAYMTRVFSGERTFLSPVLRPVELAIYKLAGINEGNEQHAVTYTIGMLLFHAGGNPKTAKMSPGSTQHMLASYNSALQKYVTENHYMDTFAFHTISGRDIIKRFGYPACK